MKEAIQKAIEGGYVNQMIYKHYDNDIIAYLNFSYLVSLDPLFWSALGKSLGWPPKHTAYLGWKNRWHDFIDHLASGKDAESFFKDLIN